MSIWGKIIGGVGGFAIGGPLGALLGGLAGHAVDRLRGGEVDEEDQDGTRQIAFTIGVIVLGAKMAKADGACDRCVSNGDRGLTYDGAVSRSVSGRSCLNWKHHAQWSEQRGEVSELHPEMVDWDHSMCRNPDGVEQSAWCYTAHQRRELCDIGAPGSPKCANEGQT